MKRAKDTRRGRKRTDRGCISISAATFERLQNYSEQNGTTMASIVRAVTADIGKDPS